MTNPIVSEIHRIACDAVSVSPRSTGEVTIRFDMPPARLLSLLKRRFPSIRVRQFLAALVEIETNPRLRCIDEIINPPPISRARFAGPAVIMHRDENNVIEFDRILDPPSRPVVENDNGPSDMLILAMSRARPGITQMALGSVLHHVDEDTWRLDHRRFTFNAKMKSLADRGLIHREGYSSGDGSSARGYRIWRVDE